MEAGFTDQVQNHQLMDEGLGRSEEAEAFSRCCVDGPDEVVDVLGAVVAELGLSRQVAPQDIPDPYLIRRASPNLARQIRQESRRHNPLGAFEMVMEKGSKGTRKDFRKDFSFNLIANIRI